MSTIGTDTRHNICIYTLNVSDGVGDTAAAIKTAEELHKLKEQHQHPIVGIVEIQWGSPNSSIIRLLKSKLEIFEKVFILTDDPEFDHIDLPEKIVKVSKRDFKQSQVLTTSLEGSELYIDIYNMDCGSKCGEQFDDYLSPSIPRIRLSELGVPLPYSPDDKAERFELGMRHGFWIESHEKEDSVARAKRLISFENKEYLEMLLRKKDPALEEAVQYLDNHRFMPGYLQNKYQTLFFILTQVLKNCDENGNLMHHCDFHLGGEVDPVLLIKALKELGLKDIPLHFVDPSSAHLDSSSDKPSIRIISRYFLNDRDFKNLYLISQDGVACSGDNSFQDAMSSHHPVFIAGYGQREISRPGQNQFIKYFATGDFKDEMQFTNGLESYAQEMLACTKLKCMNPMLYPQNEEEEFKTILNQAQKVAIIMQHPDFEKDWEEFRRSIHKEYNFTEKFPKIIHDALNTKLESKSSPTRMRH